LNNNKEITGPLIALRKMEVIVDGCFVAGVILKTMQGVCLQTHSPTGDESKLHHYPIGASGSVDSLVNALFNAP
jgi:hypothetical protein